MLKKCNRNCQFRIIDNGLFIPRVIHCVLVILFDVNLYVIQFSLCDHNCRLLCYIVVPLVLTMYYWSFIIWRAVLDIFFHALVNFEKRKLISVSKCQSDSSLVSTKLRDPLAYSEVSETDR